MSWQQKAIQVLQNDGVILCPTDTVWGLSANAISTFAVKKVYQIKQRSLQKSCIVLVADEQMLNHYVKDIPPQILQFIQSAQKPTTVIYPNPINLPQSILANDGSIAIRIASTQWLTDFINQFGKPIISTSANRSGNPTPLSFSNISKSIISQIDYIVPINQKEEGKSSSQIIRISQQNEIEFIRR